MIPRSSAVTQVTHAVTHRDNAQAIVIQNKILPVTHVTHESRKESWETKAATRGQLSTAQGLQRHPMGHMGHGIFLSRVLRALRVTFADGLHTLWVSRYAPRGA